MASAVFWGVFRGVFRGRLGHLGDRCADQVLRDDAVHWEFAEGLASIETKGGPEVHVVDSVAKEDVEHFSRQAPSGIARERPPH